MTRTLALALLALATGCAQIDSQSTIEVVPRPGLEPKWLGEAKTIVGRDLSARWSQSLSTIELRFEESRRCRAVLHEPVDRVESIDRTVRHGALYWEYGAGAALLAVGVAALIVPESFSNQAVDENGNAARNPATGYRLGGVFTALGTAIVGVGVYDTVRSRDTVTTTTAYRSTTGDLTPCTSPNGPRSGVQVELSVGSWSSVGSTDSEGAVRFGLPNELELGIDLPVPAEPPPSEPVETEEPAALEEPAAPPVVEAVATVRVDGRSGTFTVMAPLASAEPRDGSLQLRPQGPPRPDAVLK